MPKTCAPALRAARRPERLSSKASAREGVTPSRAVAFEDSRSGLRAARACGAHVFGLSTGLASDELLNAGAHQVIADFTAPALWAYLDTLKARVA